MRPPLLERDHAQPVGERAGRVPVGDAACDLIGEDEPEPDHELAQEVGPTAGEVPTAGCDDRGHVTIVVAGAIAEPATLAAPLGERSDRCQHAVGRARQLERPFAALRRCAPSYEQLAGPAPRSLRDVESLSKRACARAGSAVRDRREYPTVPHPRRTQYVVFAINGLREADGQLLKHLVLESDVPTRRGPGSDTRSDPLYSGAATTVTRYNVDVRCWSPDDWARIRRETDAIGPETAKRFFAAAGAFEGVANLAPSTCSALDGFAYEHHVPKSAAGERRLVEALATLGREAERRAATPSDAEAQCAGLQEVRPLGRHLGATARRAGRLAAAVWRYYQAKRLGPWSPDCRNGGAFDRNGSNVWP